MHDEMDIENKTALEQHVARIAENVRSIREESGKSQTKAAKEGGLSMRTWQRIEKGDLAAVTANLRKVADALDVDPAALDPPFEEAVRRILERLDELLIELQELDR